MDIARRYAVDLMKQIGMFAPQAALTDEQKKELAEMEIKAEVDPAVWAEIGSYVRDFLAAGLQAGKLKESIDHVTAFAKRKQLEFVKAEAAKGNFVESTDFVAMSPEMQKLLG